MLSLIALFSVLTALAGARAEATVERRLLGGVGGGKGDLLRGLLGGGGGGLLGGGHQHSGGRFRDGDRCYAGGRWGQFKDLLCVVADVTVSKRSGNPYGFGWFHPGPFHEGDHCWQHDRPGVVQDTLCVVADLDLDLAVRHNFDGWFTEPYYGYGHRFGWYHPGPFVEGDRCWQDGYGGIVENALCVIVDAELNLGGLGGLGLGKRSWYGPDYWYEPHFGPGYDFGWFHDGAFADGDRCWKEGHYGSILNSLCVIADIGIDLKRGLGGLGDLLDLGGGSGTTRHGKYRYREGDRCATGGQWGYWRSNNCVLDLDLGIDLGTRSVESDAVAKHVASGFDAATGSVSDAEVIEGQDEEERKRSLLNHRPGQNKGDALGKIVSDLLGDIKTRDQSERTIIGDALQGRGVAMIKRQIGGLDGLTGGKKGLGGGLDGLGGLGELGGLGGLVGGQGKGKGKGSLTGGLLGGILS